jgi:hypothetical protein
VKSLAQIDTLRLTWIAVGARSYQLDADGDLVATLDWRSRSGSLARGEASDGAWTFKRAGFFRPYVTVRAADGQTDLALLRRRTRREGILRFRDGREFHWRPSRIRRRQMAFVTTANETLFTLLPRRRKRKRIGEVEIAPGMSQVRELSLLALVGWYFTVLQLDEEDEMIAVTVAISAAI